MVETLAYVSKYISYYLEIKVRTYVYLTFFCTVLQFVTDIRPTTLISTKIKKKVIK